MEVSSSKCSRNRRATRGDRLRGNMPSTLPVVLGLVVMSSTLLWGDHFVVDGKPHVDVFQPLPTSRSMHEVLFQPQQQQDEVPSSEFYIEQPIYGTINGYDSGGPDAVCWVARLYDPIVQIPSSSSSSSNTPGYNPTDIVLWNDLVTKTAIETTAFQQMPSCLVGTNLTIRPIWKNSGIDNMDPTIWHDRPVTLEVTVEVDIFSYAAYVDTSSWGNANQVWVRIFSCSASKVGFCHPLLDTSEWNTYYPDPANITAQDFMYTEDQILDTFSTNPNTNLTFTTPWISQKLVPVMLDNEEGSNIGSFYRTAINISAVMLKDALKGDYYVIGHAVMALPSIEGNITYRLDMSNGISGAMRVATYPDVSYLSKGSKIFMGVVIGICGLAVLCMTAYIVYHRNHKVMTLAQAGLLTALAASNCVTILFSFLLMPVRDIFCQLQGLLLISSTIVPAILVARLWRVYSTLRSAMTIGRREMFEEKSSTSFQRRLSQVSKASEAWIMQFLAFLSCSKLAACYQPNKGPAHRRTTTSLRRAITRRETIGLIISLTFPQVVIQMFSVFYYDSYLWLQFSSDLSSCRQTCYRPDNGWVYYTGLGYMAAMFLLATYVAYVSRHLPSAFNEKDEIFRSAFLNGCLTVGVSVFLAFSDSAVTPPDLSTTLLVLVIVLEAMVTSYMVVMPKIRRVRSGEPVVMTNILRQVNGASMSSSDNGASETTASIPTMHPIASGVAISDPELSVLHLHANDAIPKKVEQNLHSLNEIVESVTYRW
jgi:hypothetical protein